MTKHEIWIETRTKPFVQWSIERKNNLSERIKYLLQKGDTVKYYVTATKKCVEFVPQAHNLEGYIKWNMKNFI